MLLDNFCQDDDKSTEVAIKCDRQEVYTWQIYALSCNKALFLELQSITIEVY